MLLLDVIWVEEQHGKKREKRDLLPIFDVLHGDLRRDDNFLTMEDLQSQVMRNEEENVLHTLSEIENNEIFNDELWDKEWYLKDTRTNSDLPKLDLNVLKVYEAGITGRGIRISVLDDGLEHTHEDLIGNYDSEISYDCNEEDDDPTPRYDEDGTNNHGTRCAGEIAMMANNKKCGVGVAYNANIGGIKVLDGLVTDRLEGTALSFGTELIDIYSASWGPPDDGVTVDGPGRLAQEAFRRGTRMGRQGKGSIYVWASGNGGGKDDNCNCDGYLNSIFTISIGSASERGIFPWYGEACSSLMAVTYSSGAYSDQMIVTTDLHNNCTVKHTGTSASAPLAAGILALALEVNPSLTWRDIQHLIVWTSEFLPLIHNSGWHRNGIGLWFNNKFGFGLLNAFRLVQTAVNWMEVPEKDICIVELVRKSMKLQAHHPLSVSISTAGCEMSESEINYLEHVEIRTTIKYSSRGSLEVHLTSPLGTVVQLLATRKLDHSTDGFVNWSFMSVMTWGENPRGVWTLTVEDKVGAEGNNGYLKATQLVLHGTKSIPSHMKIAKAFNEKMQNIQLRRTNNIEVFK
ncbi:hypothetical protein WA026_005686 [Henosepilachna vigintioctopunctata]|uniref:furin n=1 Tax=Henosepilachna vigintioctopunctata TaxID=420089 RepID=A0AAW1TTL1_9CUCU